MKKILKKSLSVMLSFMMVFSLFSMIAPVTVRALPATDSTYAKGDKYGTPAYTGTGDRWFKWATGSDYVTVYYPSHIYLDVSETLQSAGYHFDVEWHYGDTHKYRILLGAPIWGDHRAFSGQPTKYYTMTNIFSDYAVDASLPKGAPSGLYGSTSSSTDYDLRIVGYGHANQGTDGFTINNARHDKYVLFRTNVNYYNPASASIYLMGTPSSSYVGTTTEYNTSGSSIGSYGLAQNYPNGWKTDESATNMFKTKGSTSSYMEGEWIEMQWFVTVYDKSALNSEIVKAGQILQQQNGYNSYVVQGSYTDLVQQNTDAQTVITTRAQTQTNIDNAKNSLYNTASNLYYGASNEALRNLVAQAEEIISKAEYTAKYTEDSRKALESALSSAKSLSYYSSVPTYRAYTNQNAGKNAASDQSAINSVASALQTAINNLNNSTAYYTIKFNLADGTTKKLTYTYGFNIPSNVIPQNSVKASDAANHYSYSWDKEIVTTVTGDAEYTEVLKTEAHDWNDWYTTVYPSCTADGQMYRTCKICNFRQDDTISKTAHTPLDPVISDKVEATCKAEGSYVSTVYCDVCGNQISQETVTVPKKAHTPGEKVKENEIKATCTTDGSYEEVVYCDVCDEQISRKEVIVGASHTNSEPYTVTEESTCIKQGFIKTTVFCTECSQILDEKVENLPLAEHNSGEEHKENETEASCTTDGGYDMVTRCTVCNEVLSSEHFVTSNGGHDWNEWETVTPVSCTTNGLQVRTCKNDASHKEERILTFTGHTEGEPEEIERVDADCLLDGYYVTATYCTVCGAETSKTRTVLPATGHSFGNWYVNKEASCAEEGEEKRDCNNCKHYETKPIEKTAHNYTEAVTPPTCTLDGYTTYTCSACGDEYIDDKVISDGHTPAAAVKEKEVKATCTVAAYYEEVIYCDICGEEISRNPVYGTTLPHTEEAIPEVEATCTQTGLTAGVKCSVCGEILTAQEETPALHHDMGAYVETKAATCTEAGEERADCSRCDYFETREIAKKAHTEEEIPAVAPTCTEDGLTAGIKCSVCGEVLKAQETDPKLGHDMGEFVVTTPATCTAEGEERSDCSRCDYFETQEIAKAAHTEEEISAVAPTCTEDGLTAGVKCSVCDEVLTAQETDPKLGHDMGEYVETKPATCKEAGEERADCSRCDYFETQEIEKVAHTEEEIPAVAPDCENDGLTAGIKCSVCGEVLKAQETAPKLGHDMGEFVVTTPATCTAEGEERADCSRCDYFETQKIEKAAHSWADADCTAPSTCTVCGTTSGDAIGHDMGEYVETKPATCTEKGEERADCSRCDYFETREIAEKDHTEEEIPAVAPTCLEDGLTAGIKCAVCGEVLKAQETDPKLGHDMGEFVVTTPATCTAEGEERSDCSRCDYFETQEIAKADHTEEEIPAVAPTCLEDGLTAGVKCSVCGEVLKAQETAPKLGHDMGEFVVTTPATCTAEGEERKDCSRCDYYETQEIAKVAHTEEEIPAVAPTCTEDGLTAGVKCAVCGEVLKAQETDPKLGHDMGAFVVTTPATCKEAGEERSDCSRCDYFETQEIAKLAHTEEEIPAVAPDCINDGLTAGIKCSVCGEVLEAQQIDPAKGHTPAEAVKENEKEATCKEAAYYEDVVYCDVCGDEISRTPVTGEKLAHTEEIIPATAPTCTEKGLTEGKKCSVCGEIIVAQKIVAANGHTLGEWVTVSEATCTEEGIEEAQCENCDYIETRYTPEKEHDYDENDVCKDCGVAHKCPHICHKEYNFFARFIWSIIRFVCSIFGVGRTCSCGAAHY